MKSKFLFIAILLALYFCACTKENVNKTENVEIEEVKKSINPNNPNLTNQLVVVKFSTGKKLVDGQIKIVMNVMINNVGVGFLKTS